MGNVSGSDITTTGSAFAISPSWVMTAFHVGGTRVKIGSNIYTVIQRINHPTQDFALIKIDGIAPDAIPILSNVFVTVPTAQTPLNGTPFQFSGFGQTGTYTSTGFSVQAGSEGTQRQSRNALDFFLPQVAVSFGGTTKNTDYLVYDLDDPQGVSTTNIMGGAAVGSDEGGIAPWDSGSPWIVDDAGRKKAIAVSSIVGTFSGTGVTNWWNWGGFGGGGLIQSVWPWVQQNVTDLGRAIIKSGTAEIGSGNGLLSNLYASDNQRFSLVSNLGAIDSSFQSGVIFSGQTTSSSTSTINLTLEGKQSSAIAFCEVSMRNWSTGSFQNVGGIWLYRQDTTQSINAIPGANFIRADGTVELRLRLTSKSEDQAKFFVDWDVVRIDAPVTP